MKEFYSEIEPGEMLPNIATLLERNVKLFGDNIVYSEKNKRGDYLGITWNYLYQNIQNITYNLQKSGFSKGDKMIVFSRNRLEMLELELAIMAYGGIAVPIFAHFKKDTAELLINHSDATWLALEGESQLQNIGA